MAKLYDFYVTLKDESSCVVQAEFMDVLPYGAIFYVTSEKEDPPTTRYIVAWFDDVKSVIRDPNEED